MKTLIQILLLLAFPLYLSATHIVGGEMNYRCLGNNRYEVTLTLFRDCDTGVPPFDDPAAISVFDAITNANLFSVYPSPTNNDTLPIYLPDPCLIVPSNVCIHTTTYYDTLVLNYNPNGYIIAYQRCCRNQDILNIISPNAAGATYWTYISPQALLGCNNSAVFKEWPRIYLCSGVPIAFDHSAIDADGDSIVYELCTPSHGASQANPMPQPCFAPPYPTITWQPPYGLNNMLGGPDPLTIDPVTGLLTGTPQNLGVFLVGVCLKEYRNGVLISTTRRDFQHVVGSCSPMTVAEFDTSNFHCNTNLTFTFDNNSQVVTGSYRWYFDSLGGSTAINPTFTFPDTGTYTITLIAGLGSPCIDSFSIEMNVNIEAIQLTIVAPSTLCLGDTALLVANDLYEGYSDYTNYVWTPNAPIIAGQGTDSIWIALTQNTSFWVTGTNNYGCSSTVITTISVQDIIAVFDTTIIPCNTSLTMQFQNQSTSNPLNNNYNWQFGGLGSSTAVHPSFTFPDTGTYTVTLITGQNSVCADTFSMDVHVEITGIDLLPIPSQTVCYGDSIWVTASEFYSNYNTSNYTWTPSSAISSGQGTNQVLIIANAPSQIWVSAVNQHGCPDSLSFNIGVVQVEADFDTINLACNISLAIPFVNGSTSNLATNNIWWIFDNLGTSTAQNPIFTFPDTGNYTIQLIAGVGSLCPDTATWDLYLPLYGVNLMNMASPTICQGDSVWLKVEDLLEDYSSSIQYTWTPSTAILAGQGTDSVLVAPNSNLTLQVAATNNHLCQDSITVAVNITEVDANFDTISLICNTNLIIPFTNGSTSNLPNINYQWIFDTLGLSTATNPSYTFPDTGTYRIQLIADAGGQCPDTFSRNVYLPLYGLDISSNDVQLLCKGDTVNLFVTNNLSAYTDFTSYQWAPANWILNGQGNDSVQAVVYTDTSFMIIGTNSHGCIDTTYSQASIIYISPTVTISTNPDSIFVGQTAQLEATNDINYIYNWFQDTTLSDYFIYNPEAKPRQTTTYYLTVTNQFGCTSLDSVIVIIRQPICGNPVVFVPNAFSPDGDGHNDVLMVNGNNINQINMAIYNRWGQKIFETNDQNIGWDGSFNGKALPPDVYGYYMQCTCDDGGKLFLKGNITLLK